MLFVGFGAVGFLQAWTSTDRREHEVSRMRHAEQRRYRRVIRRPRRPRHDRVHRPTPVHRHPVLDRLLIPYRQRQLWAWWALWIAIAPVGLVFTFFQDAISLTYLITAGITALAQFATLPRILRGN